MASPETAKICEPWQGKKGDWAQPEWVRLAYLTTPNIHYIKVAVRNYTPLLIKSPGVTIGKLDLVPSWKDSLSFRRFLKLQICGIWQAELP